MPPKICATPIAAPISSKKNFTCASSSANPRRELLVEFLSFWITVPSRGSQHSPSGIHKRDVLITPIAIYARNHHARLISGKPLFGNYIKLILKSWVTLDDVPKSKRWRKNMFHLVWYILIGLIA